MASDQSSEVGNPIMLQPYRSPSIPPSQTSGPPNYEDSIAQSGLYALTHLDKIFIHQKIKIFSLAAPNKYIAVDQNKQPVYDIREDPHDLCSRLCFGGTERSFVISFTDASGHEAIRLERTMTWCKSEIFVYNGSSLLGSVHQSIWSCVPKFRIFDVHGQLLYNIVGDMCAGGCSPEFMVCSLDGNEVGLIKKQWAGFLREAFTDIFGVSFPVNLDVRHKALILGAAILIDFAFFEQN